MTEQQLEHWNTRCLVKTLASAPPAVRMLGVVAWVHEGKANHTTHPVLAIESRVELELSKPSARLLYDRHATLEAYLEAGWWIEGERVERTCLVVNDEWGDVSPLGDIVPDNGTHRLVVCSWPASEDEERLANLIEQTRKEAFERQTRTEHTKHGKPEE